MFITHKIQYVDIPCMKGARDVVGIFEISALEFFDISALEFG
jgi:hypothetical protein